MANLRQLLKPATPKTSLSWRVTKDQRPGVDALHMHHPEHGTISVNQNPGTGMYEVKHNGAYAGLGGNKGILPSKQEAYGHAKQYIHSLLSGSVVSKQPLDRPSPHVGAPKLGTGGVAKEEPAGSKAQTPNANADMSVPAIARNIDQDKANAFVAGFNRATGVKKSDPLKDLETEHGVSSQGIEARRGDARIPSNKIMAHGYGRVHADPSRHMDKAKQMARQKIRALAQHRPFLPKSEKAEVNEPLMKPYASDAQRRWAHTEAGKKALGGESAVRHWDKATKGKKLPEKVKKSARDAFGQYLSKADKPKTPPAAPAAAPESYNPKLERPAQRERVKSFMEQMKGDPTKRNISFSVSNSKLAKDGIASFNLPAVETCPGAGKCAKYCYADTGSFLRFYKTTMPPRVQNYLAAQGDDFADRAIQYLDQWKKTGKHPESGKRFPLKAIRIHDSGDFFSPKYIDQWTKIAKAHPDVMLYAYTKSHHPVLKQKLKELQDLPNVNIVQSLGSKYDHLVNPDEPHAVVFESPEQMKAAGYADAMSSDLTAADKKNKKVGLYIHGSASGGYAGLEDHLAGSPDLKRRIMADLANAGVPVGKTSDQGHKVPWRSEEDREKARTKDKKFREK